MEISLSQRLFARDIPGRLCLIGFPAVLIILSLRYAQITSASLHSLSMWGWLLLITAVCIPLGVFSAAIFISIFLAPIYQVAIRRNGGPFNVGDKVYVFAGKYKGTSTKVYSQWQGLSVRILLGEKEEKTFKDVISPLMLIKKTNGAEQSVPGYPPQGVGSPEP